MKDLKFNFKNSLVKKAKIAQAAKKLKSELKTLNRVVKKNNWNDPRASILLPNDKLAIKRAKHIADDKLKHNPTLLVVCGIGGSNLGTIAVQEAILGKLYNEKSPKLRVIYADTTDPDKMADILAIVDNELRSGNNVVLNGISKSGGTTETIVNFELLAQRIEMYKEGYNQFVVVTTSRGSKFWNLALEKGFATLEIPRQVGGRYSVFSSVGLFPLAMLNINLEQLLKGAEKMRTKCLSNNINKNPAMLSAATIHALNLEKKNICDHFIFSTNLESLGRWYRQLMGESIGKEKNTKQKKINSGITPTVSVGSTDLHSMAQLYLGGPNDKVHCFISVDKHNKDIKIPKQKEYGKLVPYSQGIAMKKILNAIYKGTTTAFKKKKRSFIEIIFPDKSEFTIGQFLQMKMIEMMFLANLLDVNAFDQPSVESYKIETKKFLTK